MLVYVVSSIEESESSSEDLSTAVVQVSDL